MQLVSFVPHFATTKRLLRLEYTLEVIILLPSIQHSAIENLIEISSYSVARPPSIGTGSSAVVLVLEMIVLIALVLVLVLL